MQTTRRDILAGAGALTGVLAAPQAGFTRRAPNILFIIADQWSVAAADLSGGVRTPRTPALDSLAASGTRFDNAYCTFPLCSPSRASLFTGRMPHECGVMFNYQGSDRGGRMPSSLPRMGELFAVAGYDTAYFGKEHVGGEVYRGFNERGSIEFTGAGAVADGSALDPVFVRDAIQFIRRARTKPFLAVLSLINPHDICYIPVGPIPPEKKEMVGITTAFDPSYWVKDGDPVRPARYLRNSELPPLRPNARVINDLKPRRNWTEQQIRNYLANYYLLMENTDWNVSLVLRALRDAGVERDTLILFTSDHGEMMGAHGLFGKLNFFEEAARVPFVLTWPGVIPPGRIIRELVSGTDVLPTLLDYAGIPAPPSVTGRSVRPLVEGRKTVWRQFVVAETVRGRMVRSDTHKYMIYRRDTVVEHLFDMRNDPLETRDLADDPASVGVLQHHRDLLASWGKDTGGDFDTVEREIQKWFS